MRRFCLFILLALLIPALAYAEPAIVFVAETHDFGTVEAGATFEYAFEFLNSGDDELVIRELLTS
jgi:hypothetical protein